jgi:hypothetical protein
MTFKFVGGVNCDKCKFFPNCKAGEANANMIVRLVNLIALIWQDGEMGRISFWYTLESGRGIQWISRINLRKCLYSRRINR